MTLRNSSEPTHIEEMQESRWELSAILGPCSFEEAQAVLEEVADRAAPAVRGLGAVWAIQKLEED